jgi:hypothetical protein
VRDLLAATNSPGQSHGRCASDANDTVSIGDAGYSIVNDPLGHVDEGRVEDARIEVRDQGLMRRAGLMQDGLETMSGVARCRRPSSLGRRAIASGP